ncbi:hypothetical protein BsWGS_25551 [Bradybaena similaris]
MSTSPLMFTLPLSCSQLSSRVHNCPLVFTLLPNLHFHYSVDTSLLVFSPVLSCSHLSSRVLTCPLVFTTALSCSHFPCVSDACNYRNTACLTVCWPCSINCADPVISCNVLYNHSCVPANSVVRF